MSDQEHNVRPTGKIGITNKPLHVADSIKIMYEGITKMGESGDNLVTDAELDTQKSHVDKLVEKEEAMSGAEPDKKEQRDSAWGICYHDRNSNLGKVNTAAEAIADYTLASGLIKRNGFELSKDRVYEPSAEVKAKAKKNSTGVVVIKIRKPNTKKAFCIEIEYSIDGGDTWIRVFAAAVCTREIKDIKTPASVIVRARYIIGSNDPLDWMFSKSVNV